MPDQPAICTLIWYITSIMLIRILMFLWEERLFWSSHERIQYLDKERGEPDSDLDATDLERDLERD